MRKKKKTTEEREKKIQFVRSRRTERHDGRPKKQKKQVQDM